MDRLRQTVREQHIKTVDEAKIALRAILADMLNVGDSGLRLDTKPSVILVIGVNGVGKTTTIGKLAHQLRDQGKKVLLCAGDTFRAAAADQLEIWSERAHCDIIRQHEGADPASVVYRRHRRGQGARQRRHHLRYRRPSAQQAEPHERAEQDLPHPGPRAARTPARRSCSVLDGTTGQNGLLQAKQFQECAGRHRHGADQARRHGQGRRRHRRWRRRCRSRSSSSASASRSTISCPSTRKASRRRSYESDPGQQKSA